MLVFSLSKKGKKSIFKVMHLSSTVGDKTINPDRFPLHVGAEFLSAWSMSETSVFFVCSL